MSLLESFLNNPIAVSIGVIVLSSLVGFYINSRVRDRCLRDLDGYLVTVEDKASNVMMKRLIDSSKRETPTWSTDVRPQ